MIEMEGRESAKCRKSKAWGHRCHFLNLNDNKTKQLQCHLLPLKGKPNTCWGEIDVVAGF